MTYNFGDMWGLVSIDIHIYIYVFIYTPWAYECMGFRRFVGECISLVSFSAQMTFHHTSVYWVAVKEPKLNCQKVGTS